MGKHGFYINDVFFNTSGMDSRMVRNNIDEVIKKCYDEFTEHIRSVLPEEEHGLLTVEFDEKLSLYEHISVAVNRLVAEIDRKCYGHLHSPIKAFLRLENDKLIFRCADGGRCFIDDDLDDIHSYMSDYAQFIKPIAIPVTKKHEYVNVIKIKDVSGEWITHKNPEKVEYVNDHANVLIEDKGIEHVIRFAQVKRYTLNLYRIVLNQK